MKSCCDSVTAVRCCPRTVRAGRSATTPKGLITGGPSPPSHHPRIGNAARHMRPGPPVELPSGYSLARHTYVGRVDDSHRGIHAMSVPTTYSTSPSVNTPRKPSKLRRAKQISGTASATKRRRFMSTASCFRPTKSYPDLPALMFSHSLIPAWLRHAPVSPVLTAIRPASHSPRLPPASR